MKRPLRGPAWPRPDGCSSGWVFALILLGPCSVQAQPVRNDLYVTNGTVNAMRVDGDTLYIGGSFTQVGPATGSAVPLSSTSGQPVAIPRVVGTVYALVPDGSGGWYVGGSFTSVGGTPRSNIAHVLGDNTLSSWNPGANGVVRTLAVSGSTVYAGGDFTTISGQTRNRIAALDAATADAGTWDPNADAPVGVLVVNGSTIYAGGSFASVGAQARNHIASLDVTTGNATAWNPGADGVVRALAVGGPIVYAGGDFTMIGGQPRQKIAAVDAAGGVATDWNPGADASVLALAIDGSSLYAGGDFTTIAGQIRNRIAVLDVATGSAFPWDPNASGSVAALVVSGSTIYAGGAFTTIGGATRNRIAALDAVTASAGAWNPNANDAVLAVAASGSAVCVGGAFTSLGGQDRNNLAALDATDGTVTAWNPDANGAVNAIDETFQHVVCVGGEFTTIGGQTHERIAGINKSTGNPVWTAPGANATVRAIVVDGSDVFVGGDFTSLGGSPRNHIGAVDIFGGAVLPVNADVDGPVYAIATPNGECLPDPPCPNPIYIAGQFAHVNGSPRSNIAAFDLVTGQVLPWNPGANGLVRALALAEGGSGTPGVPVGVFAAGEFSSVGGQPRNFIANLDAVPLAGNATTWNPSANGPVHAVILSAGNAYGSVLLAGGNFTGIGGQVRNHIAALDTNGVATSWNPDADGTVRAIAGICSGCPGPHGDLNKTYIGGDFLGVGGMPHAHLAGTELFRITFHDVTIAEGNAGTTAALFPVTLSQASSDPVSVDYYTYNSTPSLTSAPALAGVDYVPTSGTVTFQPGQTQQFVAVQINGDSNPEETESFFLAPTNVPANASTNTATGTIVDDDGASQVRDDLYSTNRQVRAVVRDGNTIYIGGDFTRVGSGTGNAVALDPSSGQPVESPRITGGVRAVVPDGSGGWFVGGDFTHVAGALRFRLLHINADRTIAAWNPSPNRPVLSLALSGSTLYVGGQFSVIGGQVRNGVAAFDVTSGSLAAWNPDAEGGTTNPYASVYALAVSGTTVYAGGDFSSIGGRARSCLAALDATGGVATEWSANTDGSVLAIAVNSGTVFAGGEFIHVNGMNAWGLVSIDAVTGHLVGKAPGIDFGYTVSALALDGSTLYVGGHFFDLGNVPRSDLGAVDITTGAVTPWNPSAGGDVAALAVEGGFVYVGGAFSVIGGQARTVLAALDATTGLATPWDPSPNGSVFALAAGAGKIYAGGSFTMAGGTPRSFLAALDLGSGKATAWNPGANGTVSALAAKGGIVYAAGSFSEIGGQPRNHLASLDAVTGVPTSWDPEPDGEVDALAMGDSTIYVAGTFANVGPAARNRIAAFDAETGLLTPWDPNAGNCIPTPYCCDETCVDTCYSQVCPFVVSLALSGSTVYAGGSFDYIGGQPRHDLAALDAATGQATPWNPSPSDVVSTILVSDSTVYAAGHFTSIGGKPRDGIAALRATDGLASPWNPAAGGGTVLALALGASNDVYAGGVFQGFGNTRRPYLAQIDAAGSLTDWNPLATGGPNALVLDGPVLYAAGAFSSMGDLPHAGLAVIQRGLLSVPSSDKGAPFFWARLSPNPTHGPIDIDFTLAAATGVRVDVFDLQGRRVVQLMNGSRPAGSHHVRWTGRIAGGMAPPGVYLVRLQAAKRSQTRHVVVIR